jgi:hypothetical protein
MNPNDVAPLFISVVLFISTAAVLIFRGPIGKAIARRIEGSPGGDEALAARVVDLEHRLADIEQERLRVGELEERLDFAERLLATGPERPREGSR